MSDETGVTSPEARAELRQATWDDVDSELWLATGDDASNDEALDWHRRTTDAIMRHVDAALAAVEGEAQRARDEADELRRKLDSSLVTAVERRRERDEARAAHAACCSDLRRHGISGKHRHLHSVR